MPSARNSDTTGFSENIQELINSWLKYTSLHSISPCYEKETINELLDSILKSDPDSFTQLLKAKIEKVLKEEYYLKQAFRDKNFYKKKSQIIYKYSLLFCYLSGTKGFPWPFNELETANMINFFFEYSGTEANFEHLLEITKSAIEENYHLDLSKLDSEKTVSHIKPRFIYYVLKGARKYLGLGFVYLLFFKDNNTLAHTFFTKVRLKALSSDASQDPFYLEFIERIDEVFETLVKIIKHDADIENTMREAYRKFILETPEFLKKYTTITRRMFFSKDYFDRNFSVDISLTKGVIASYLDVSEKIEKVLEEIKTLGKYFEKNIAKFDNKKLKKLVNTLYIKVNEIAYFDWVKNVCSTKFFLECLPSVLLFIKAKEKPGRYNKPSLEELEEYANPEFVSGIKSIYLITLKKLIQKKKEYGLFQEDINRKNVLEEEEVIEKFRSALKRFVNRKVDTRTDWFSKETFNRQISKWRNTKKSAMTLLIDPGNRGEEFEDLLEKHLPTLHLPSHPAYRDFDCFLPHRIIAYYYLARILGNDPEKYEILRSVFLRRLSPWLYVFIFKEVPEDFRNNKLEFLEALKKLSFAIEGLSQFNLFNSADMLNKFVFRDEKHASEFLFEKTKHDDDNLFKITFRDPFSYSLVPVIFPEAYRNTWKIFYLSLRSLGTEIEY